MSAVITRVRDQLRDRGLRWLGEHGPTGTPPRPAGRAPGNTSPRLVRARRGHARRLGPPGPGATGALLRASGPGRRPPASLYGRRHPGATACADHDWTAARRSCGRRRSSSSARRLRPARPTTKAPPSVRGVFAPGAKLRRAVTQTAGPAGTTPLGARARQGCDGNEEAAPSRAPRRRVAARRRRWRADLRRAAVARFRDAANAIPDHPGPSSWTRW